MTIYNPSESVEKTVGAYTAALTPEVMKVTVNTIVVYDVTLAVPKPHPTIPLASIYNVGVEYRNAGDETIDVYSLPLDGIFHGDIYCLFGSIVQLSPGISNSIVCRMEDDQTNDAPLVEGLHSLVVDIYAKRTIDVDYPVSPTYSITIPFTGAEAEVGTTLSIDITDAAGNPVFDVTGTQIKELWVGDTIKIVGTLQTAEVTPVPLQNGVVKLIRNDTLTTYQNTTDAAGIYAISYTLTANDTPTVRFKTRFQQVW